MRSHPRRPPSFDMLLNNIRAITKKVLIVIKIRLNILKDLDSRYLVLPVIISTFLTLGISLTKMEKQLNLKEEWAV
jgi:hypothetical protein